ncbi:unnamed protein product [Adineta steineri]|uniref:Uncharacterized protein n=1 Tax=Adineta steineri TaxID=433720 RepID=A0A815M6C7_9BILA|nr:unnamed protein product [Adineta steineri]CAF4060479.1 unnamed protein product [Adineta steineri]
MTATNRYGWYLDDGSVKDPLSVEMLTNGNFESNPTLTGWNTGSNGSSGTCVPTTANISSTYSHSSSLSYYVGCSSGSGAPSSYGFAWISQSFSALSGAIYTISFWVYLDKIRGGADDPVLDVTIN